MADMRIYLAGGQMPRFTSFEEITQPNASEVFGLNANLNIDFVNYRVGWRASWKLISVDDYNKLKAVFNRQFSQSSLPHLLVPGWGISTPVYMKISEANIRYRGGWIEDFRAEFWRQDAIS